MDCLLVALSIYQAWNLLSDGLCALSCVCLSGGKLIQCIPLHIIGGFSKSHSLTCKFNETKDNFSSRLNFILCL